MKRLLAILTVMLSAVVGARAQDDVAFTNFWKFRTFYNPAAAGLDKCLDMTGAFRMEMAGFEDAGQEFFISADMPLFFLSMRHGVGLGFVNDKIGLFSNKRFWLDYAYHQPLGKKNRLSIGIRFAMINAGFNGSKVELEESGDEYVPTTDITGFGFDMDLGLRWDHTDVWYVGASCTHLLSPKINLGDEKKYQIKIDPHLYGTAGYNLKFRTPVLVLKTDAMFRTNLQSWRTDLDARLYYEGQKIKMYGGLDYAPTISVAMLLGFTFHGLNIGYSYEFYTGGISAQNGTHEIHLGYNLDLNFGKKGRNYHQSVRWL